MYDRFGSAVQLLADRTGETMNCETQDTICMPRSENTISNPSSQPEIEQPTRKLCLMRCGLKFYLVYQDDGSLVRDEDATLLPQ